jgi:L-ascorbate metabolism protein UlaG (beta-lactamase superfamily)
MNIEYYGHSCFKITAKPAGRGQEEVVIFIDPFDKKIGLRPPQGQADVVLVTHHHYDHDNVSALKGEPVVFDIPGEYSVKGVNIIGLQTYHNNKNEELNTVFLLEAEDLKICHLGDLGCDLTEKQLEELGEVDVLMIPVGGKYTIDAKKAEEIAKMIEPNIIIPMHYKMKGSNITDIADEKGFCDEIGSCPKEKVSKLNLKKKDLEGKSMEVVVMNVG